MLVKIPPKMSVLSFMGYLMNMQFEMQLPLVRRVLCFDHRSKQKDCPKII